MFNGGIQYIQYIVPNLHTEQYPTITLDIITIRNVYRYVEIELLCELSFTQM